MHIMEELDYDLQHLRDAGPEPDRRAADALLRRHDAWVRRVARARLRHFRRAEALYDEDDVAQVVRQTIWRALGDYRYICPGESCRRWRAPTREAFDRHVARRHRGGPTEPMVDVGRYVRVNVTLRVGIELRRHNCAMRVPTQASDRLPPDLVELAAALSREPGERGPGVDRALATAPDAEAVASAREALDAVAGLLTPAESRLLAALAAGYSRASAAAGAEVAGLDNESARLGALRAARVLALVGERIMSR